ncbi:hypothetical protein Pcinc_023079 [Petrolisthes cinctipes]|uniref:Uncharacterized protein n=1 Tax=Petrolisthes cinctipes TaxID=88211 RepID=A0AAE1KFT1_PETCI|nr:hypothetical protein Pcinc_023079 [Petrolisthes cinctipes]
MVTEGEMGTEKERWGQRRRDGDREGGMETEEGGGQRRRDRKREGGKREGGVGEEIEGWGRRRRDGDRGGGIGTEKEGQGRKERDGDREGGMIYRSSLPRPPPVPPPVPPPQNPPLPGQATGRGLGPICHKMRQPTIFLIFTTFLAQPAEEGESCLPFGTVSAALCTYPQLSDSMQKGSMFQ